MFRCHGKAFMLRWVFPDHLMVLATSTTRAGHTRYALGTHTEAHTQQHKHTRKLTHHTTLESNGTKAHTRQVRDAN